MQRDSLNLHNTSPSYNLCKLYLREFVTNISRRFAIDSMRNVILFSALTLMAHICNSISYNQLVQRP